MLPPPARRKNVTNKLTFKWKRASFASMLTWFSQFQSSNYEFPCLLFHNSSVHRFSNEQNPSPSQRKQDSTHSNTMFSSDKANWRPKSMPKQRMLLTCGGHVVFLARWSLGRRAPRAHVPIGQWARFLTRGVGRKWKSHCTNFLSPRLRPLWIRVSVKRTWNVFQRLWNKSKKP